MHTRHGAAQLLTGRALDVLSFALRQDRKFLVTHGASLYPPSQSILRQPLQALKAACAEAQDPQQVVRTFLVKEAAETPTAEPAPQAKSTRPPTFQEQALAALLADKTLRSAEVMNLTPDDPPLLLSEEELSFVALRELTRKYTDLIARTMYNQWPGKGESSPPIIEPLDLTIPDAVGHSLGLVIAELSLDEDALRYVNGMTRPVDPDRLRRFAFGYKHYVRGRRTPDLELREFVIYMKDAAKSPKHSRNGKEGTVYRRVRRLSRERKTALTDRLAPIMSGIMPQSDRSKYRPGSNNRGS